MRNRGALMIVATALVLVFGVVLSKRANVKHQNARGKNSLLPVTQFLPSEEEIAVSIAHIATSVALVVLLCKFVAWMIAETTRAIIEVYCSVTAALLSLRKLWKLHAEADDDKKAVDDS